MWDLENPQKALWEVKGHTGLINAIDGCGGQAKGYGAPEVVTCGQDGECGGGANEVSDMAGTSAPISHRPDKLLGTS